MSAHRRLSFGRILGSQRFAAVVALAMAAAPLLPASGDEPAARWSADRSVGVEVRELHAFLRNAINVRRLDVLAAHATEVRVAHVIDENEDDVGLRRSEGDVGDKDKAGEQTIHLRVGS